MKRVYILLSLAVLSMTALAQEAGTHHYLNLYGKAGWAGMLDGLKAYDNAISVGTLPSYNVSDKSLFGGPGVGLGFGYELQANHFLFDIGVEADWLRSTSQYGFEARRKMVAPYNMDYIYRFYNWRETRSGLYAGVPIALGAQFGNFYFLLGAKVAYGIFATS